MYNLQEMMAIVGSITLQFRGIAIFFASVMSICVLQLPSVIFKIVIISFLCFWGASVYMVSHLL